MQLGDVLRLEIHSAVQQDHSHGEPVYLRGASPDSGAARQRAIGAETMRRRAAQCQIENQIRGLREGGTEGSVEGADFEESAGYAAAAIAVFADLVGVTCQGNAGGARFIRHRLADGGHDRGDDGQGKHSDDEYCS